MKAPCAWAYTVIYCCKNSTSAINSRSNCRLGCINPRGVEPEVFITQTPMTGSCLMAYEFSPQLN